jgi:predicted RNase H-like HicB family nuclease
VADATSGYAVIVEQAGRNYSAYAPDLPGCVATGKTVAETLERMRGAIRLHLQGLAEDRTTFAASHAVAAEVIYP